MLMLLRKRMIERGCVVLVTYFERYYGVVIDIHGLTIHQVS